MKPNSKYQLGGAEARLWVGDGIRCLSSMAPGSVDLIVTSPPYFLGKEYDTSNRILDFCAEIRRAIPAVRHALRPGGSICFQVGNHVQKGILAPLDAIIINEMMQQPDFMLRNRIIWTFGHGTHAVRRFSGRHETILWYTKGEDYAFDLDAARVPQRYPGKRHYKGPKKGAWSGNPLGKNPGDVWEIGDIWDIPNVKANHVEKTDHPCQFPTALVRRLILALCPEGGVVADPYMGSGTTAIAALLEGRSFAGVEMEPNYFLIAKERLSALIDGRLRTREDIPIRLPRSGDAVSQRPPHFR